jgi:hypothetical protein
MYATYPFMATIFAVGFSTPGNWYRVNGPPMLSWRLGAGAIATILVALLVGPSNSVRPTHAVHQLRKDSPRKSSGSDSS